MKICTAVNIVFALAVVGAWQFAGAFIAESLSAAAEVGFSATGKPELLEAPYVYLWFVPLAASLAGWCAYKFEYKTFGRFVVCYPGTLLIACLIWFQYFVA